MAKRKKNIPTISLPPRLNKILTRMGAIIFISPFALIIFVIVMMKVEDRSDYSQMSEENAAALKAQDSFWDKLDGVKVEDVHASYYDGLNEVGCKDIEFRFDYMHRPSDDEYVVYKKYGVREVNYFQYPWTSSGSETINKRNDNDSFEVWIELSNGADYPNRKYETIRFKVSKINFAILKVDDLSGENGEEFWLTDEQQHELMNYAIDQFKEYQKEYFKINK